jgi:hypothetical protein
VTYSRAGGGCSRFLAAEAYGGRIREPEYVHPWCQYHRDLTLRTPMLTPRIDTSRHRIALRRDAGLRCEAVDF